MVTAVTRVLHLHLTFCSGSGIDEVIRNLMKQTFFFGFNCELACFHAEDIMIEDVKPSKVTIYPHPKYVTLLNSSFGLFPLPLGKILAAQASSVFPIYRSIKQRIDGADIIHAHFYPFTAFSSFVKPKSKKLVIHNYGITKNLAQYSSYERFTLVEARQSEHLFSAADVVISISDFLRKDLFEHTGIDSIVIPPGIDVNHFQFSLEGRKAIRSQYNVPNDAFVILFVGRLVPYKKVDLLIESFYKVKQKIPNSKLIIAPSPRCDKTPFEIQVRKLGLEKDVIFAEKASFLNMPSFYSACDVNASCTYWEGFGLPFIEAAACGKPSVGFAGIPGLEVLAEKGLGLRVEQRSAEAFAEKLLEARSKSWDSQRLRDLSTRYGWEAVAKLVSNVYINLS